MLGDGRYSGVLLALILGLTVTHILFATWPGLDLWVAGLFYWGDGFPLADLPALETLRNLFWNATILLTLGCLLMWGLSLGLGHRAHVSGNVWLFGWLSFILGPGLLVNALFKSHWGRARPAHLEQFGGTAQFTPPFEITDQCARNCSFVSGEGASAVMFALVMGVLFWHWIAPRNRPGFVAVLSGIAVVFAMLRVMKGRHFLSDVLIGGWMMALLALGLFWALNMRQHLPSFHLRNLRADMGLIRTQIWHPALRRVAALFD